MKNENDNNNMNIYIYIYRTYLSLCRYSKKKIHCYYRSHYHIVNWFEYKTEIFKFIA